MNLISFDDFISSGEFKDVDVSMTIGVFDGLHAGHMALLHRIYDKIDSSTGFLFTFHPNPKRVLGKRPYHKDILSLRQKTEMIANNKIENMVLIDFSPEFSKLRGEDFFSKIADSCRLRHIVFGENFSCGYQALFHAARIKEWFSGSITEVDIVPSVMLSGERVSSSRIRRSILEGDMTTAAKLLGRSHSIDMANIPHVTGSRTFDIEVDSIAQILPPPGLYDVSMCCTNESEYHGEMVIHRDTITCHSDEIIRSHIIEMKIIEHIIGEKDGIN
ncbi:MAG: hypothetical protein K9M84_02740 [Spirochaetia bacterium]|nr:hypothetical protein [Spirochaetia bacterium]